MPATLFDLSDELLAHICNVALKYEYPELPVVPGLKQSRLPNGLISSQLSIKLRELLRPFRATRRLYSIGRREFLESNAVLLTLSDLRMSACRLEQQPTNSQIICTGNPDPLLVNLVHIELSVSISDMRAPFTQPFGDRTNTSGVRWKSRVDVLSLNKEAAALREMASLCRSLKTVHVYLKVDEWYLYGMSSKPNLRRREDITGAEERYRDHAELMVDMMVDVPVKIVTVSFNHWSESTSALNLRDLKASEVVEQILPFWSLAKEWAFPIGRVMSGKQRTREVADEPKVKSSWGSSDEVQKVV